METFELHPRLAKDCITVGDFSLSRLLLMNDSNYPWFILVPRRAGISEIYQLNHNDRQLLLNESCYLAEQLTLIYQADKLNIASIGNKVPQLHLHHIVRYQSDIAWAEPVWGKFPATAYNNEQLQITLNKIRQQLQPQLHCEE